MTLTDEIIMVLVEMLRNRSNRKETVNKFQLLVWERRQPGIARDVDPGMPGNVYSVLADLAYDLDYFESDPLARMESESYYGDERLEELVGTALRDLEHLGVKIPDTPSASDK